MYLHMKVCFLLKQYRGITIENQRVKGGGLIYLRVLLNCNFHMGGYTFAFNGLACATIQCVC